jgi:hypothetical protein
MYLGGYARGLEAKNRLLAIIQERRTAKKSTFLQTFWAAGTVKGLFT